MVTNTELLDEIALRKAQILEQGKQNINSSINNYNTRMTQDAQLQNKGALNSYNNYMTNTTSGTDRQIARSAYLNRLGSANDAALGVIGQMNANKNIYGAYLESAGLNAEANINNLAYNDYVKQAELAYQRERDKIKDKQADKEYALDVKAYKKSRRGYGGGRSYGGDGSTFGDGGNQPIRYDGLIEAASGAANSAKKYKR